VGFRLYKSVSLGKGVRLNLSKTGVGISAGIPGLRYSVHSSGRRTKTASLPGTGISYRQDSYAGASRRPPRRLALPPPTVQMYPKAGLLAPRDEKLFVQGVTAYMQGRHEQALEKLIESSARERAGHIGDEFFTGMCLVGLERNDEAIPYMEHVVGSDEPIPDGLMRKYGVGGQMAVAITSLAVAEVPMTSAGVALLLAELYQRDDRVQDAIELVESLGALSNDAVCALSLADLYSVQRHWNQVVRVTDDFTSNTDDITTLILVFRARALSELGLQDASVASAKEALRFKKRAANVLHAARYQRALTYEAMNKRSQSRRDLERIYAEAPDFADVADRLGRQTVPPRPDPTSKRG
jgi:tetratricopeptide (TPR) repeat protein